MGGLFANYAVFRKMAGYIFHQYIRKSILIDGVCESMLYEGDSIACCLHMYWQLIHT